MRTHALQTLIMLYNLPHVEVKLSAVCAAFCSASQPRAARQDHAKTFEDSTAETRPCEVSGIHSGGRRGDMSMQGGDVDAI